MATTEYRTFIRWTTVDVSPLTGRVIGFASLSDDGAAIIHANSLCGGIRLHTLDFFVIAAPTWSVVFCSIDSTVATSHLHLELRALPSNSRKPASARLDRAL